MKHCTAWHRVKRIGSLCIVSLLLTNCALLPKTVINDYCLKYEFVGLLEVEAALLPKERVEVIDKNDLDYQVDCKGEDLE